MKVLLLNTSERIGGAAIAANRLMKALYNNGIEVKALVLSKQTNDENVISIQSSFLKRQLALLNFLWERWVIFVHNRFSRKNLFKVSIANTGFDISTHPLVKEADLIHIHWINQGFLSLTSLEKLIRLNKPIVWTMHDLWTATGICHYPENCEKYTTQCCHCPMLVRGKSNDLSYKIFTRKKALNLNRVHYVGCSRWMAEKAQSSILLQNAPVLFIANPIDTKIFIPKDKNDMRKRLQLPLDKCLLLFSAAKIADTRKGGIYFIDACRQIFKKHPELAHKVEIVWMGKGEEAFFSALKITIHTLHYISSESELADVYSSVDAFVIPSLEDNLPNTIMESMACGTPCIGFEAGGISEMIDHKINGYVAKYQSTEDLAQGIYWTLFEANYERLSHQARQKVLDCYSEDAIAKQYIHLYQQSV
ncbi:MAG: glycosyltransferase family 4 protein [Candidatus Azobacteroides sp.]|nr:glycosyltransferase family 4 protein [Candidatus Azobacteroides sp.]